MSNVKYFKRAFNFSLYNDVLSQLTKYPRTYVFCNRMFSCSNQVAMRFMQYTCKRDGPQRLGVQLAPDRDIIEVSAVRASVPNNLVDFLRAGPQMMDKAKRIVAEGESLISCENVNILPPITKPDKIICVGLNYKSHCDEQKKPYPKEPFFFSKFPSTIVGPNGNVIHPPNSRALDWEVELAVIMGKECRNVFKDKAKDYIFGYTVAQDISARDWQKASKNHGQWLFAKSMDTFCPLGPAVVAKEFIADPHNLRLTCSINGSKKQDGNTSDMVHDIYDLVSYLSHCITLLPGDIILTGTPSGVGIFSQTKQMLQVGDIIESEISGLGKLTNHVVSSK